MSAYSRGQRRGVRGLPRHHARGRTAVGGRGVPRRRAGCAGCRAPRSRSPRGCARRSATASGCPSPSASPAPSSWPRSPARRPSPTGCCWCRRTASWRSCIRCRCAGCGASAPRPPRSCTRTASRRSPMSPSSASRRSASMVGGAMGRQLFALSRNIDRRRVVTGVRRRSVGAQRALGRRGNTMSASGDRRRRRQPGRPDHPPDAQGRAAPGEPWCCGCGSTTSAGPPGRTRCRGPPRRPTSSSPPHGAWSRRPRR